MVTEKEEYKLIRKMMRDFTASHVSPKAHIIDQSAHFDWDVIRHMSKSGIFGTAFPEAYGGAGLDSFAEAIVLEELARCSASVALTLLAHNLVPYTLYHHGSEGLKDRYLRQLISGQSLGAFALTEPETGSDVASIRTSAEADGGNYLLNGGKAWITNFSVSNVYIIAAKTDRTKGARGISLFLVEKEAPGLIIGSEEKKLGMRGTNTGSLAFDNCKIPAANLIGEPERGFVYAMEALDIGRMSMSAMAIGIMQRAYEESIIYARERQAFGKNIGSFQSIHNMIADMRISLQASRAMLYEVAMKRKAGEKYALDVAMLKVYSSETAVKAALDAIQIFGANGYSSEYPVECLLRDAKLLEIGEGTSQILRMIIGTDALK
jgi:butyryl-CoA dehydrogenase